MGLGKIYTKVECEMAVEERYSIAERKPNKREPQSLKRLNQSANAKSAQLDSFMRRQHARAPEPTAEQVQRSIRNMFDSLDNRRGW